MNWTFQQFWSDVAFKRHQATQEKIQWFAFDHLKEGLPRDTSERFFHFMCGLVETLKDGPQLTICLDKLLESKDRAVSQAIADSRLL